MATPSAAFAAGTAPGHPGVSSTSADSSTIATMSTTDRATVHVRRETFERAERLRDELAATGGHKPTMTDTIDRAIRCLEEVQTRSAWTTPSDPRLRLEQHIATLVTSALSQFIRDYLPDEELSSLTFDFHRHTIAVHLAGEPRLRRIILTPDSRYLDPTEPLPELYREGRRRSR